MIPLPPVKTPLKAGQAAEMFNIATRIGVVITVTLVIVMALGIEHPILAAITACLLLFASFGWVLGPDDADEDKKKAARKL